MAQPPFAQERGFSLWNGCERIVASGYDLTQGGTCSILLKSATTAAASEVPTTLPVVRGHVGCRSRDHARAKESPDLN